MSMPTTYSTSGRVVANGSSRSMGPPSAAVTAANTAAAPPSNYSQSIAKSMTIEEMRQLHHHALEDAQAKKTELRLVLASRYRELVGSSDEVLKMRERSQELHQLVHALPSLMTKLQQQNQRNQQIAQAIDEEEKTNSNNEQEETGQDVDNSTKQEEEKQGLSKSVPSATNSDVVMVRRNLSRLPRSIHRYLDQKDVHGAATTLVELFTLITLSSSSSSSPTPKFPLAKALSASSSSSVLSSRSNSSNNKVNPNYKLIQSDAMIQTQLKMTYLMMERIPAKTIQMAKQILSQSASYYCSDDDKLGVDAEAEAISFNPHLGAAKSAAALATLHLLSVTPSSSSSTTKDNALTSSWLIDLYFESKAKLLHSLLQQLTVDQTETAEDILSKIVLILQYDVILHPYQFFIKRQCYTEESSCKDDSTMTLSSTTSSSIMESLPYFDTDLVKRKASKLLAAHLALIRQKVKSVLVEIAGTTASALGQIRQSLYDKTDGIECMELLSQCSSVTTWEEALQGMVDSHVVLSHGTSSFTTTTTATTTRSSDGTVSTSLSQQQGQGLSQQRKFSLWSALFSNTFSSLVHSLLTTSFHSVHSQVVSTLRTSLANAPPLSSILPHEAYRNTLKIATELDAMLLRVSDDAHELLVHAEERVESERRLRQSLYVQTCEIMGRLLCELRRMLSTTTSSGTSSAAAAEATKAFIVGRLCYLLKFRLTSLPTLLDAQSSPAMLAAATSASTTSSSATGANATATTASSSAMISILELQSAFDLADDNEDGLITFEEAMEASDSAFSGTQFHGAQMVRETLLLTSDDTTTTGAAAAGGTTTDGTGSGDANATELDAPRNVTLEELALLSARGLRHESHGPQSALGTIQKSLNDIIYQCFTTWSHVALQDCNDSFTMEVQQQFVATQIQSSSSSSSSSSNTAMTEMEYKRIYDPEAAAAAVQDDMLQEIGDFLNDDQDNTKTNQDEEMKPLIGNVSPHVVGYLLSVSSVLNRSICPSDSLMPVPSNEYAIALGIENNSTKDQNIATMTDTIRWALLDQALSLVATSLDKVLAVSSSSLSSDEEKKDTDTGGKSNGGGTLFDSTKAVPSACIQFYSDVSFLKHCFFERNKYGFHYLQQEESLKAQQQQQAQQDNYYYQNDDDEEDAMEEEEEEKKSPQILFEEAHVKAQDIFNNALLLTSASGKSDEVLQVIEGKHRHVLEVCDLLLSALFGEEDMSAKQHQHDVMLAGTTTSAMSGSSSSAPLLHNPLPSSRRFVLLPIQSERSLNELQARGKYRRGAGAGSGDKSMSQGKQDAGDGFGVVSSGLGFFSSMLKKK